MNEYKMVVVVETEEYVYLRLFINNTLVNPEGLIRIKPREMDQFFKDLFKGSKGNCIKCFCMSTR